MIPPPSLAIRNVSVVDVEAGVWPFPDAGIASYEHGFFPALRLCVAGRDSLFRRWAAEGVAVTPTLVASAGRLVPRDSLLAAAVVFGA